MDIIQDAVREFEISGELETKILSNRYGLGYELDFESDAEVEVPTGTESEARARRHVMLEFALDERLID